MASTKIDLATQTSGNLPISELPKASANSVLVGSGATGSGAAYSEISLGTNLSMSGTTLNASGSGSGITELTGDVTAGPGSGSQAATLANTAVTPGSYTATNLTVDSKGRITAAASGSAGGGTVTTTGSPASGNLSKFSGATSITNDDLSGDVTTSGTLATTIAANAVTTTKINNSAVTLAKIANAAASSKLLGSGASGSGSAYSELSPGTGLSMSGTTLNATGLLLNVQRITATGAYTYTPTAGTNSVIIELQAAGGGGAGVASPGGSTVNIASGGASGGWQRVRLTANFSGGTGSVGAKGTGGAAGNNNGNAGGNTTFITTAGSPVTYTSFGGGGGAHQGAFGPPFVGPIATATATTTGDDNQSGVPGCVPIALGINNNLGGSGGANHYSGGAPTNELGGTNTSSSGANADGKGGGGAGAVATGSGGAVAGGNGSDGIIIIWEYS